MISNPVIGAGYFLHGLRLLNVNGVRRYVWIPLLFNISLFIAAYYFASWQFDNFVSWAMNELPNWLHWLKWILWPLFSITFLALVFFSFSIIANIVAAPFNAPLAAAVERYLTGNNTFTTGRNFREEIRFTVHNEWIKLKHALYLLLPLGFITLMGFAFPLISPAVSLLWLAYSIWILTLEYADYPMSNHGLAYREIRERLASKRFLSLGFGSMVMLATLIPLANFIVIPVAVAGATKLYVEHFTS